MMNKKTFVKKMEEFKSIVEDIESVHKAIRKLDPDFGGFYLGRVSELIVSLLSDDLKDESDWIGYYIWERNWGKDIKLGDVTKGKKKIPLKTFEDLYNCIVKK